METPNIIEARQNSIREVTVLPKVVVKMDKEAVDPFIIIDVVNDKVRVFVNKIKLFRTLNKKNDIESALDITLVDNIKELLEKMAKKEENYEKIGGVNNGEIPKSNKSGRDDSDPGQGGTPSNNDRRFV